MAVLDPHQLAEHNGQEGKKAYVAVDGRVYDVTESKRWKGGKHMMRHNAGADLSAEIKAAPHGADVLERFTQVATLATSEGNSGPRVPWPLSWIYAKFPIVKRHAHPVTVHFPIAFALGSALFLLLFLLTNDRSFIHTSLHLIVLTALTAPVAILTGFQSWWLYYGLKPTKGIMFKIVAGLVIVVAAAAAWVTFAFLPVDARTATAVYSYLALVAISSLLVLINGAIGGQMTFPD